MRKRKTALVLGLIYLVWTCGSDFDPYNRITELRLLAIQAEQPMLSQGGSTKLNALVYHPENKTPAYQWSWCPLRGGTKNGYECMISEADFQKAVAGTGIVVPSYDLGSDSNAEFTNFFPSMKTLQQLCVEPLGPQSIDASGLLDCKQGFPVSIGLAISHEGKTIEGYKTIYLSLEPNQTNSNPSVTGLSIATEEQERTDATLLSDSGVNYTVEQPETYKLFATVGKSVAEKYLKVPDAGGEPKEVHEVMSMTWFVEAGDTKYMRTSLLIGKVGLDILEENEWELPNQIEFSEDEATIFLVLRDNRGGVAWFSRTVLVTRP